MNKITCILFAVHHSSDNIASLRFKNLIKYVDPNKYEFIVLTKDLGTQVVNIEQENLTIIPIRGELLGQGGIWCDVKNYLYFITGTKLTLNNSWAQNANNALNNYLYQNPKNKCVVVGTYSPIDALIGASKCSKINKFPLVQDFRDGLLFESLGRKSTVLRFVKQKLEAIACKDTHIITSVSKALVDDFRSRYRSKAVKLLHNGFDPADFDRNINEVNKSSELHSTLFSDGKLVIGHFGRVSGSDFSSFESLVSFLKTVEKIEGGMKSNIRLLFMGQLTNEENELIRHSNLDFILTGHCDRDTAISIMKNCDYLLLLTGNRVSCATGKIFEYINTRKKIICFTRVLNEATRILSDTKSGQSFLVGERDLAAGLNLFLKNKNVESVNIKELNNYNKVNQAKVFEDILEKTFNQII